MIDNEQQIGSSGVLERGSLDETITFRTIEALMSNYPGSLPAVLELVDNAVDDRIPGKLLTVNIFVSKDEISIRNIGGEGLGLEGLKDFFKWGISEKGSGRIGRYGVGGKGAMGYLGRSMEVTCSEPGSDIEYQVTDTAWEQKIGRDRVEHEWIKKPSVAPEGYFKVRVWHLKRNINHRVLAEKLGDIYRPLLMDDSVSGQERAVHILIGSQEVKPMPMNYLLDNPDLRPKLYQIGTPFGEIKLAAGIVAPDIRIKPGFRCYFGGRLISDAEFFGFPTPDRLRQAQKLIGEAHLDFVPVTANKSDFDRGSIEWEDAFRRMTEVLVGDWKAKLESLPMEQTVRIDGFEKELARMVRRDLERIIGKEKLLARIREIEEEAEKTDDQTNKPRRPRTTGIGGERKPGIREKYEQLTIPPIEIASLAEYNRPARIVLAQGRVALQINADHPLYQAAKGEGDVNLRLFMDIAAADGMARFGSQGQSQEDYHDYYNELLRSIGEFRWVRSMRAQERRSSRTS